MAQINKALSTIVANLTALLSQVNANTSQPEVTVLQKAPQMTYYQFLTQVLAGHEALSVQSSSSRYRLQQDLQILLGLSNQTHIAIKSFQSIASEGRIKRTPENMQKRYFDVLYQVQEKDIKNIVEYIQKNGLHGYLLLRDGRFVIQKTEPVSQKRKRRIVSSQTTEQKQERLKKALKSAKVPNNCKQLSQILTVYSKMVNIPMKTLLKKLDQVSGDLIMLDKYIETKDARILWTPSEDEILKKKSGPELQTLKKYRGNTIQARKKYLGIN